MKRKKKNMESSGTKNHSSEIKMEARMVESLSGIKTLHTAWKEFEEIKKSGWTHIPLGIGKYQYVFSSRKGMISLIELKDYIFRNNSVQWEIYCLNGNLFEDVERFGTKEDAIDRIRQLLL
jgi:hypothetical protein